MLLGEFMEKNRKKRRLETIDTIRGLTMISMILYHFCWDLKYINGFDMAWYGSKAGHIWQQSICWSFILISGFCLNLSRKPLRNGALVFCCGVIVTCVTILLIPEALVMFGVLTMLGSCMLLVGGCELLVRNFGKAFGTSAAGEEGLVRRKAIDPFWEFFTSVILFAVTKTINYGYLNFGLFMVNLPGFLYKGQAMTYLGFKEEGFYSTDHFSLMPWIFLFLAGYFLYGIMKNAKVFSWRIFHIEVPFISMFGRHALIVYMLHQPVLYGISMLIR